MRKYFICILLPAILLMISSCALTVKPASTKSAKAYYESFFVGENGTQYFIKPIELDSEIDDAKMLIDFTFRYKNEIKDSSVINFSIIGTNIIRSVDNIVFTNIVSLNDISLLFNEKKGDKFISRFSVKCSTKEMIDIFNHSDMKINVTTNNTITLFLSHKKTQKIIRSLNDNLFVLFRTDFGD